MDTALFRSELTNPGGELFFGLVWRLVAACKDRSAYWQRHANKRLLAGAYARLQSLLGSKTE